MKYFFIILISLVYYTTSIGQVSVSTSTKKYHQTGCRYFNPNKIVTDLVGLTPAKCCNKSTTLPDGTQVEAITCGALTKKGTPCKRRVHNQGDHCPSHNVVVNK